MIANPLSLNGMPPPTEAEHKWRRAVAHHLRGISLTLMALLFLAVILAPYMVKTVTSGHAAVLWKRFSGPGIYCWCILSRGTVLKPEEIRGEGLHIIWPWDKLFEYDLRLQSTTVPLDAISSEGVRLRIQMNIRIVLNADALGVLHKYIGPGYMAQVVVTEVGSSSREIISKYTAEEVYATKRADIEKQILELAGQKLTARFGDVMQASLIEQLAGVSDAEKLKQGKEYASLLLHSISIVNILLLGIELPEAVVAAINRKAEQFYVVQEYKFRVKREELESERKRIEAQGIRDFQKTVSQGISDSYLRWRGIEATVDLSKSANSKIVVIGSGKDGLPIILGNVDTPPSAAPKPADGAEGDKKADDKKAEDKKADGDKKPAEDTAKPADKPADKTPVADSAKPAEKKAADASADKPRALFPLSFSDLESLLSKVLRAKDADSKPADKPAADKPAEEKAK